MAVQTIVTQSAAGPISLNCRSETGGDQDSGVNATNFIITAVKLGSVNLESGSSCESGGSASSRRSARAHFVK